MSKKVGIVGAGLSGLSCAVELKNKGYDVEIFEQSNQAGGRVQTDEVEGFKLDHGFQVYLPAYEMGQKFFDHKKLDLKSFRAGSEVFYKSSLHKITDPLRSPMTLLKTLAAPFGSFKDKMLILKLKGEAAKSSQKTPVASKTTRQYLIDFGFSKEFITCFFEPFFSGVFLEKKLETPSSFFLYLFDKFSKSEASLPKNGMKALIDQLLDQVGSDRLHLGARVVDISENHIRLEGAEAVSFDFIVVAVDNPDLVINNTDVSLKDIQFNKVTTFYFKTESKKYASKYLFLNSEKDRTVNHVACLSAVQKSYARKGWELFSVNVVSDDEPALEDVLSDLKSIFDEEEISKWTFLKSYFVKRALPSKAFYGKEPYKRTNGVYICGDYMESPSIQGALSSGVSVAQEISKI